MMEKFQNDAEKKYEKVATIHRPVNRYPYFCG